ncbi:uncharacterized protein PHALS_07946 [Plasmopara halstedii]|uniref:Uncharacterized protein n=1 Tax=Plasmopara halstedii TaxID=4781 RepID=A0A0P1B746_PLAHL|nr:uncharacterized protein PHALS_07946 [Plasmopara halstedii]CEG50222.1 hypothetical protein PHALS_07946 [Plasmopara halstedii]|eukprot:XP_024586591.1 hypothetical protein PHALS_07946 [Plasmopara halstedii]
MTAIARVEEHLATFMKKVIYFEGFFHRMQSNLPACVVNTATLLFQRCYEYRDEIRDELESNVAYVADAGRWVVGMGDWNSKMEKRLNQINELVLLANTLLTEYAVTGQIGAEGCRDELNAYLQILSATVTLRNPKKGKQAIVSNDTSRATQSIKATDLSSEMSALGTELSGAISGMFRDIQSVSNSKLQSQVDNDAMNPFTDSYRRPVDPYATVSTTDASTDNSVHSSSDGLPKYTCEELRCDGDFPKDPLSPVSLGEYECLDINSIPKYAAFKSSAQLAARRQSNGFNNLAVSLTSDGESSAYNESGAEYPELFPLPAKALSESLTSSNAKAGSTIKSPIKPIMDMNYSYDFRCEEAHNPFISSNTRELHVSSCAKTDFQSQSVSTQLSNDIQPNKDEVDTRHTNNGHMTEGKSKTLADYLETNQDTRHSDEFDLFGIGKS